MAFHPFYRPSVRYGQTPDPVTPYQKAAQVWDERLGSARVQASNWRIAALGATALSTVLGLALSIAIGRSSVVPYVVEVDRLGEVRAVGPALEAYKPSDAQIAHFLARFVEYVRSLSMVDETYADCSSRENCFRLVGARERIRTVSDFQATEKALAVRDVLLGRSAGRFNNRNFEPVSIAVNNHHAAGFLVLCHCRPRKDKASLQHLRSGDPFARGQNEDEIRHGVVMEGSENEPFLVFR